MSVERPPAVPAAANRRFAGVAAIAFAAFFACDTYLFSFEGFRRSFGDATQEGQELSKVARSARLAAVADVIAFGSSYVRSGLAGEPFLERQIVPFNFAASGAGPLYSYFALRRIAPILRARADRPWLVVELKRDALEADTPLWAEYPQYLGIVRSRAEMVRFAPMLWRSFRDYGMTSPFLSSVLIPSSIYRSYAVPILGAKSSLAGYFYGMEDVTGYAPLYTVADDSLFARPRDARPLHVSGGKRAFLAAFLELAREVGCRVALLASPTLHGDEDADRFDGLIAELRGEFPDVRAIRTDAYQLARTDFDEGGHPNLRGADAVSRAVMASLDLHGTATTFPARLAQAFDIVSLPDADAWTRASRARAAGPHAIAIEAADAQPALASIARVPVRPGIEYVLESAVAIERGRVGVNVAWVDRATGRREERGVLSPRDPRLAASTRLFLRFTPRADAIDLTVVDSTALNRGATSEGRVELLRLWGDRP